MFTVKRQESVNKTVHLKSELVKRMERIAYKYNISLNQLIVQCCEYALDNVADEEK